MWFAAFIIAVVAFLAWAVRGRSAAVFAPSIWRIPAAAGEVAATTSGAAGTPLAGSTR